MMPQTLRQCSFFALEEPEDFGIEPSGRCALEFNCFTPKKNNVYHVLFQLKGMFCLFFCLDALRLKF